MKRTPAALPILLILFLMSLACSGPEVLSQTQDTPRPGAVLFQDDFSNPKSGWGTLEEGASRVQYQDGGLRILVGEAQYDYWSTPGEKYLDTRVTVEAARMSGSDNNDFGILCRYKDPDNFYALLVSSDGYAGILKVKEGEYNLISGEHMDYFEAIQKGSALNRLEAKCAGSKLVLSANGEQLLAVDDFDFMYGEVGVIAGSYDESGVDIFFDNFIVYNP